MSITKDHLAAEIYALCHLRGRFVLRSGGKADTYFDKYRFESRPDILADVAKQMVSRIPTGTEILAGLEVGEIPIATMLSHYSGLPAAFVRKAAKQYGTARLCEGADVSGKRVLLVEDMVTTGGQVRRSSVDLRNLGALITHTVCVIDRGEGGSANLRQDGIVLLSLFDASEFPGS